VIDSNDSDTKNPRSRPVLILKFQTMIYDLGHGDQPDQCQSSKKEWDE